jgi:hypothetical protein
MLRNASKAVKAYRDDIAWFPKEKEMLNGVVEHEEFLKEVVITTVAKARKVPRDKLIDVSESESMDTLASEDYCPLRVYLNY